MAKVGRKSTPGISRIDQPEKHNHGFFVRVQRRGKIHSAFFTDKMHGGRAKALVAAKRHHRRLVAKLGLPRRMSRRRWAQLVRRKGTSGVVGVQKLMLKRRGVVREYWLATWSPKPYVAVRKFFSVRKHGYNRAKLLAMRARRAGLRSME